MRWIAVALFCAVLTITCAEPDPKKYKPEIKTKDKTSSTNLTDEDKKFLREVEEKFGIKPDLPLNKENKKEEEEEKEKDPEPTKATDIKPPFPAIIAIEIVNDTDTDTDSVTKTKGKRTIDANLGYGYRTNSGYTYTYLGKQQEKGKFMIYPYSQEDIPPAKSNGHSSGYTHQKTKQHTSSAEVEILPSQAYELVPAKEEEPTSYNYEKPAVEFKEESQGIESPPPPPPSGEPPTQKTPSTLYATYNGQQFSGFSGQFPSVKPNYLVDTSQLLTNPQYQSAGLTQDYLRSHGAHLEQRVVPVLVLRIPSSYLRNPTAELYANLPQNQQISQYLNHMNLQELVNQYFKKLGYTHAPQVTAYPNSPLAVPAVESSVPATVSSHEPQQYASPYVQPTYTHADHSGVQYSAVQPVMARYPSGYRQQYYITQGHSIYRQPVQQRYVYRYRYVPQPAVQTQAYYVQPQYRHQTYQVASQEDSNEQAQVDQQTSLHDASSSAEYGAHDPSTNDEGHLTSVEYTVQQTPAPDYNQAQSVTPSYENAVTATQQYQLPNHQQSHDLTATNVHISGYGGQPSQAQYQQYVPQETVTVYPRSQSGHRYSSVVGPEATQTYVYQKQVHDDSADNLVLTENYPSKDHTIATVLPISYKNRMPVSEPIQAVSYVTPIPHVMKYHSQYRVMVPQTIFRTPTSEKVTYVNSHSLPASYSGSTQYNPEAEYTVGAHYVPPIGKQKPPLYPRNYHSHKRMIKPENKSDTSTVQRKHNEKSEKKKSA